MKKTLIVFVVILIMSLTGNVMLFSANQTVVDSASLELRLDSSFDNGKVVVEGVTETNERLFGGYNNIKVTFYGSNLEAKLPENNWKLVGKTVISEVQEKKIYLKLIGVKIVSLPNGNEGAMIEYGYVDSVATPRRYYKVVELYGFVNNEYKMLWTLEESIFGGGAGTNPDSIEKQYVFEDEGKEIIANVTTTQYDKKTGKASGHIKTSETYYWGNNMYILKK